MPDFVKSLTQVQEYGANHLSLVHGFSPLVHKSDQLKSCVIVRTKSTLVQCKRWADVFHQAFVYQVFEDFGNDVQE